MSKDICIEMRFYLFLLMSVGAYGSFAQNPQMNLMMMSHWNDTSLPAIDGDQRWNDITGWNDTSKNREYLIAGSNDSVYFFDITDPLQMIKCDVEEGHSRNAINRDYEIYSHYLYTVSDRSSPQGSLQIFDLQFLPDSVHKVYDSDSFSINTHTLFIEAERKRLYLCGNSYKPAGFRSMAVFDLSNPELPAYLGALNKDFGCAYTHEVFVRKDTAYCSCGNAGLYMVDMRDLSNQKLLGSITPPYVQSGFNHSGWLDSTGQYLMFTDENQGLGIKIYDIKSLSDPEFITVFNSNPGALPHNAYWKGGFAYVSSYEDGVYVYDLRNVAQFVSNQQPPVAAYFDTYTHNAPGVYNGFHGCWGVWPFLKSGLVIASDISEGLFVLKPAPTLNTTTTGKRDWHIRTWPNPVSDMLHLSVFPYQRGNLTIRITDELGREVYDSIINHPTADLNLTHLSSGMYNLTIQQGNSTKSTLFIKYGESK